MSPAAAAEFAALREKIAAKDAKYRSEILMSPVSGRYYVVIRTDGEVVARLGDPNVVGSGWINHSDAGAAAREWKNAQP